MLQKLASSKGDKVVAAARNPEADGMVDQAKLGAVTLKLDVTANAETINAVVEKAWKKTKGIDVHVNNAEYALIGAVE